MVQGTKYGGVRQLQVQRGHDVLLTQATGINNTDNCMDLGKCCLGSAVASRAVGVLSSASRF